jgi:hypothetical protein
MALTYPSVVMCWAGLGFKPRARQARPVQAWPKPSPDVGLMWAQAWLEIFEAQAVGSSPGLQLF